MIRLHLTLTKQYFTVHNDGKPIEPILIERIDTFAKRFTIVNQWTDPARQNRKSNTAKPVIKRFYTHTHDKYEYRFNIHALREFLEMLTVYGIQPNHIKIHRAPVVEPESIDTIKPNPSYTPRDYQVPYIKYLVESPHPTNLLNLQTGKGKTFIALYSICQLKKRVFFSTLPRFIDKWVDDVVNYTNLTKDDIVVLSGRNNMVRYMENLDTDPKPFTIVSNRTYMNYLKEYESTYLTDPHAFSYLYTPDMFIYKLKPGIVLFDEVHLDFASFFKIMLYSNVQKMIGLSATLEHLHTKQNTMYYYLFPQAYRPDTIDYDKYIDVYRCGYRISPKYRIRYLLYANNKYSQFEYEKSIRHYKPVLKDYLEMIDYYLKKGFLSRYENGDKCLIFAGSIAMCSCIVEYLKDKYPGKDIRRYVQDDPYENILNATICVTTILSGGTAIDIKNLTTVIQTISVVSLQSNKQTLGRLRKLSDGKECRFYYLYNKDIPPHRYTDAIRQKNLKPIVRSFNTSDYFKVLGE